MGAATAFFTVFREGVDLGSEGSEGAAFFRLGREGAAFFRLGKEGREGAAFLTAGAAFFSSFVAPCSNGRCQRMQKHHQGRSRG